VTAVLSVENWPEQAALAFALGLPFEGQDTEPECAQVLSQAEQLVHDVLAQEPGLSKRQVALRLQGRLHRALVRDAVQHGTQRGGWCRIQPGPRTAHALYLRCCGTTADAQRTVRREQPDPARPLDGYDALRLRMPALVLQDLLVAAPATVVEAYERVWRQRRAPTLCRSPCPSRRGRRQISRSVIETTGTQAAARAKAPVKGSRHVEHGRRVDRGGRDGTP
jgi:hypothetical protein